MNEIIQFNAPDLHKKEEESEISVIISSQEIPVQGIGSAKIIYFRDKRLRAGTLETSSNPSGVLTIDYMFPTESSSPIQIAIEVTPADNNMSEKIGCKAHIEDVILTGNPRVQKSSTLEKPDSVHFFSWRSPNNDYIDTLFLPPNLEILENISFEIYTN